MKKKLKKYDYFVILLIIIVFVLLIIMNIRLVSEVLSQKTEEIGTIQLDAIRSDLQDTLSSAETSLMKVAMGVEQLMGNDSDFDRLEEYIVEQKKIQMDVTEGGTFNVYTAGPGWEIIPDFDVPEDYHGTDRIWYKGAEENKGEIYITEPYTDRMTGDICFSMSVMLSDSTTVVAMDFNLSRVQDSIKKMSSGDNRYAMIVTDSGMILGSKDMSLAGEKLAIKLPEYISVFTDIKDKREKSGYSTKIDGQESAVFYSITNNGWFLILCVDHDALYKESNRQLFFNIAVNLLLLTVIISLFVIAAKNRYKAEDALEVKEEFISNVSGELKEPLNRILKLSEPGRLENSTNVKEDMSNIKESGLKLSEMIDNLFSYSTMVRKNKKEKKRVYKKDSKSIKRARNVVVILLSLALALTIFFTVVLGSLNLSYNTDATLNFYEKLLNRWTVQQSSILSMFTDTIKADPTVLDDYDEAVKWLDDIAKNYSQISVCYMANPYKEHSVIMNNGWQPEEGWDVTERQWYKDTEKSESDFNVSAPYYDDQTGNYCVTISKMVYGKNDEFLGVFAIDYFLDKLIDVIGQYHLSDSYAFLVDSSGVIINHPDKDFEISADKQTNISDTVYSKCTDPYDYEVVKDYDGKRSIVKYSTDNNTGFRIFVVGDWWEYNRGFLLICSVIIAIIGVGMLIVVLLVNRMIRMQNEANRKLSEAADAATAAGNAKSQFLAQMSHEIRTPINAVIGMDEMILRESKEPEILEYAGNIKSAGKNLLNLINGVLDFSKIEEGKMEIIPTRYDVGEMIKDLIFMINERAKSKGIELKTEIDPSMPKSLFGDDVRIKQIITNLLTNSVKYTKEGSVTLIIGGVKENDDNFRLGVAVKDTGIGIKEEDMDKLFMSFQRLDEEKNRNIEGTGLGISIVSGLLSMMDSRLKVESEYGKGSTFSFEINQKIIDSTELGTYDYLAAGSIEASKNTLIAHDASVLVVDDNDMNLKVAKGLMKRCGIVPDLASSGRECIEMLKSRSYDIVFLDHMMPGMDGIETLKKIKQENLLPAGTAVIVLTANAISGAKEKYMEQGFTDYLAKPIEVSALENILSVYLPKDKISYDLNEKTEENVINESVSLLESYGFNTKNGIEYSGGMENFYFEMLEAFTDGADVKADEIKADHDSGNIKDYRTRVHALKSTARMIGADALADEALEHENAAKEENKAFIDSNAEKLLEDYRQTVEKIKKALQLRKG